MIILNPLQPAHVHVQSLHVHVSLQVCNNYETISN